MEEYNCIEYIKSDLLRLTKDDGIRSFLRWYFFPQGSTFPHDVWLRIMHQCKTRKRLKYTIGILVYFIERHYAYKYGIFVNSNIHIGRGLKIVHGCGVFLNCSYIGNEFTVFQGVTIGASGGMTKFLRLEIMLLFIQEQ